MEVTHLIEYLLCFIHFIKFFFLLWNAFLIFIHVDAMCWYLFCLCCTLYLNFKTSLRYPIVLFAKLIRRWRIVCTLAGRAGVSVSPSERLMRRQKGFEWRWLCPKWRHSRISVVYNRRKERLERAAREREKKSVSSQQPEKIHMWATQLIIRQQHST